MNNEVFDYAQLYKLLQMHTPNNATFEGSE